MTSNVNLKIEGLNDMKQTVTVQGGDKPLAVSEVIELKPLTVTDNVNIGGTDKPIGIDVRPLTLNENIDLKPVTLNENVDVKPVTLNENIDLKPVAVDTCQTYRVAPLPRPTVRQPYRHHIGYHDVRRRVRRRELRR